MRRLTWLTPLLLSFAVSCTFDTRGLAGNDTNNTNTNANNANNTNTNNATCGNGVLDVGEACDGADLDGATCESLGYAGSGLVCDAACQLDASACDPALTCGDGLLNAGEECDGAELDGATCASLGYHGTGLLCDNLCRLDPAPCIANGRCGDGTRNGPEACDGADLAGSTCGSLGLGQGNLTCSAACQHDTSDCGFPEVCTDGVDNDGDSDVDCADSDCAADLMCTNTLSTYFDADPERVELGTLAELTGNSPVRAFSVSYWVKFNGIQPDWAAPMGASSNSSWGDGFGFYHSSEDRIRFWINRYDSTRATTTTVFANEVWYHVVGTYDANAASGNIKIYIDGGFEGQGDLTADVTAPGAPVTIGSLLDDDMVGFIDEVAFWSVALSAPNVAAIYNGGSPLPLLSDSGAYDQSGTLTAYYRMGDGDTLPTLADHAGAHPGTLVSGDGDELVSDTP